MANVVGSAYKTLSFEAALCLSWKVPPKIREGLLLALFMMLPALAKVRKMMTPIWLLLQ